MTTLRKTDVLQIRDLHASIGSQKILNGIDLTIQSGEIHAIMGPNGSGKSTLCHIIMGHPKYEVTHGEVLLNGENILELDPNERANRGIFLGFQAPLEISGVTLGNFLRLAKNANRKTSDSNLTPIGPVEFMKIMKEKLERLKMDKTFAGRSVNEGFSGGEKKRTEIVQMSILEPKIALLDEIDSGLDIDALRVVAQGIQDYFDKSHAGILLITHYERLLKYVEPHCIHVMAQGRIIASGGKEVSKQLEKEGYSQFLKN